MDETADSGEEAIADLHPLAHRVAFRLLGDKHDAEDAAQEAVERAVGQWHRIQPYARNWIVRVVTNLAIDKLRERGRIELGPIPDTFVEADTDTRVDLHAALASLPVRQRQVVVLRVVADLPVSEVARLIGCSEGAVKRHLFRAKSALRISIEGSVNAAHSEGRSTKMVSSNELIFIPAIIPAQGWPARPWDHWLVQGSDGGWDRLAVDLAGNIILDADGDEVMSGPGFQHEVVKVSPGKSLGEPDPEPDLSAFDAGTRDIVRSAVDEAAIHGHPWVGDENLAMALVQHTDLSGVAGRQVTLESLEIASAHFYEGPWAEARLSSVRDRRGGASFSRQPSGSFSWNHALRRTLEMAQAEEESPVTIDTLARVLFSKSHCLPLILLEEMHA